MHPNPQPFRAAPRRFSTPGLLAGLVLTAAGVVATAASAEGTATRDWTVADFRAVEFSGRGSLVIEQGDRTYLTASGPSADVLDRVEVRVRGGELRIDTPDRFEGELAFRLGVVELEALDLSGAVDVRVGALRTPELDLDLSGASDVTVARLEAERLTLDGSGASDVELAGTVDRLRIDLSGAGTCKAGDLVVRAADLDLSGAGNVFLHVTERLEVEASGAADIRYRGRPTVESRLSGAGRVRPVD